MSKRSLICVLLCLCLLTAAGCGKSPTADPAADAVTGTDAGTTVAESAADETQTEQTAADAAPSEVVSEADSETTTEAEAFDPHDGLNSTDVAEVLAFYQWAAAFNDKKQYSKTLDLISIDAGSEKLNDRIDVFEPIAKKAVAKNSVTDQPLPGKYKTIRPADWQSAEAVSDGKYTTITVKVSPQTDGAFGKEFEGPVGRTMTVLNGIAVAIDELPGVSADFENGDVRLEYQNPTMQVRIDNSTGLFVPGSCTWHYRVHPVLASLDAKVLVFSFRLEHAEGYIDYTMSY